MQNDQRHFKVNTGAIILAILFLAGILIIGYGLFRHEKIILYIGLAMTLAGVSLGIFRLLVDAKREQ